jgi:hypothetical protein
MARKSKDVSRWPAIPEVAAKLDVGEPAIRSMISRGILAAEWWFDGKIWRRKIDPESLAEFLATRVKHGPGERGGVKWLRKKPA